MQITMKIFLAKTGIIDGVQDKCMPHFVNNENWSVYSGMFWLKLSKPEELEHLTKYLFRFQLVYAEFCHKTVDHSFVCIFQHSIQSRRFHSRLAV